MTLRTSTITSLRTSLSGLVLGLILVGLWPPTEASAQQPQPQAQPRVYPNLGGEYIIISGGPAIRRWEDLRKPSEQHDRWWGNFIRPARMRFEELRKQYGPNAQITWLV